MGNHNTATISPLWEIYATEDDLVIIKDGDEFKLAYETEGDGGKNYFDADSGDKISYGDDSNAPDSGFRLSVNLDAGTFLLIMMLAVLVFGTVLYVHFSRK